MSFYKQLARFKKLIEAGEHLPINNKAKVAVMNAHDNQAAAKNLVNLVSRPRARRELQNIMNNKPWLERLWYRLDPYSHLNEQYKIIRQNSSPAIRNYHRDIEGVNKAVEHYNKQINNIFDVVDDKSINSLGKNPTRLKTMEVGEEVPGVPWWGAVEVPNPNMVADSKKFMNLPKYLRNAYNAGHSVNPASGYKMKDIISKNYNR